MSGLSLRVMMVRAGSSRTSVLKASRSPEALPAVVEGFAQLGLEAARVIGARAAPTPPLGRDRCGRLVVWFLLLETHRLLRANGVLKHYAKTM